MSNREKEDRKLLRFIRVVIPLALILSVSLIIQAQAQKQKDAKYLSADRCKSCHDAPRKGNQFGKWKEIKHSKAFETLGSDKAKEVGKKHGVKDPQKSEKCLKCHVTAYEEPKSKIGENFKMELGVSCDSCHGPGSYHMETQTDILVELDFEEDSDPFGNEADEPYKALPKGETTPEPKEEVCKKCHNKDSPSYKDDWNTPERKKAIQHLDPRKKR